MSEIIRELERLVGGDSTATYVLRLYVTGSTPQSSRAVANIKAICDEHLPGRYELEVIDLYQQPELAREGDVVVAPTLVRQLPSPVVRLIGDLSNTPRVLLALGLKSDGEGR
ncbi:KaiB 1 protein [Luteitalea sp. TBR-22]|uniref:circadian clock KaiB family protein n=1 Tax=Luteitalea sp. TBR-22 TaxID=2802971 RepID=UPI001AF581BD|nr:circadian clock KaiB family protein [Luteitalea sp. TBR-22]BCS34836.1 KaiB 1 protein [Luteitalea sp. TBR-22]